LTYLYLVDKYFNFEDRISSTYLACVWFAVCNIQKHVCKFFNTFLPWFSQALYSSIYDDVVFCHDFHQTPFCKRNNKHAIIFGRKWLWVNLI